MLTAILCIFVLPVLAQQKEGYNKNAWKQADTTTKARPVLSFDSRFSLLKGVSTNFFGVKIGAQFAQRWRVGAGFYFNNTPLVLTDRVTPMFPEDTLMEKSTFYYGTAFVEFIILKRVRWEISFPWHLGIGYGYTRFYRQQQNAFLGKQGDIIVLTEFSPVASFRFCRWAGLGAGLGYRYIFNQNAELQAAYNAPILIGRFRFYSNEVFKIVREAIRKKKRKRSEAKH
ncbi:MAG: hypothetical protein KatS3mg031_2300 [Chitinophagales bacterium]|nr:MAG: hypothetical protein KatS3mg031_2300 [Chitinophagales bacterium]